MANELAQWVDRPTLSEQPQEFQDAVAAYQAKQSTFAETVGDKAERNNRELAMADAIVKIADSMNVDISEFGIAESASAYRKLMAE